MTKYGCCSCGCHGTRVIKDYAGFDFTQGWPVSEAVWQTSKWRFNSKCRIVSDPNSAFDKDYFQSGDTAVIEVDIPCSNYWVELIVPKQTDADHNVTGQFGVTAGRVKVGKYLQYWENIPNTAVATPDPITIGGSTGCGVTVNAFQNTINYFNPDDDPVDYQQRFGLGEFDGNHSGMCWAERLDSGDASSITGTRYPSELITNHTNIPAFDAGGRTIRIEIQAGAAGYDFNIVGLKIHYGSRHAFRASFDANTELTFIPSSVNIPFSTPVNHTVNSSLSQTVTRAAFDDPLNPTIETIDVDINIDDSAAPTTAIDWQVVYDPWISFRGTYGIIPRYDTGFGGTSTNGWAIVSANWDGDNDATATEEAALLDAMYMYKMAAGYEPEEDSKLYDIMQGFWIEPSWDSVWTYSFTNPSCGTISAHDSSGDFPDPATRTIKRALHRGKYDLESTLSDSTWITLTTCANGWSVDRTGLQGVADKYDQVLASGFTRTQAMAALGGAHSDADYPYFLPMIDSRIPSDNYTRSSSDLEKAYYEIPQDNGVTHSWNEYGNSVVFQMYKSWQYNDWGVDAGDGVTNSQLGSRPHYVSDFEVPWYNDSITSFRFPRTTLDAGTLDGECPPLKNGTFEVHELTLLGHFFEDMDVCTFENGDTTAAHLQVFGSDQFAYEYPSTVDKNFYLSQRNLVKMTKTGESDEFWIGFKYDPVSPELFTPELWVSIEIGGGSGYDQRQLDPEPLYSMFKQADLPKVGKKTITLLPAFPEHDNEKLVLTVRF